MVNIESELEVIESRLSESWEALAIQRTINELANKQVDSVLNSELNKFPGFWRTMNFSLQSTIFIGILALLDHSSNSATFYSALKKTKQTSTYVELNDMEPRLDDIRKKYIKYRNKLFGHNDKKRMNFINEYNAAGFTYQSIEEDFEYLDYVYKYLWQLNKGETLTDEATARNFHFPHNQSRHGVIQQTEEFLRGLAPIAANISSSNERCKAD